eukprot:c17792_g1_i1 orf=555-1688(-)
MQIALQCQSNIIERTSVCDTALSQEAQVLTTRMYSGPTMTKFWSGNSIVIDSVIPKERSSFLVLGHRGCGKNKTWSSEAAPDQRPSIKENTIISFNTAANTGVDFVEFDVQVTKDGHPVIFHDDLIVAEEQGQMVAKCIGELTLKEFLSIGPQKDSEKVGRTLGRKDIDGSIRNWIVTMEDSFCSLKDAFEQVVPTVGFNIEVKFDDTNLVPESELRRTIDAILLDVEKYAMERKVFFSSFHPDAVDVLRKVQPTYPVFFLTDGGEGVHADLRRNSVEAAIDVCMKSGLQGIVSEVRAILEDPDLVQLVKKAGFCLLTYGDWNNMPEALIQQRQLGLDGVIVDDVHEMVAVARNHNNPAVSLSSYSHSLNMALKTVE